MNCKKANFAFLMLVIIHYLVVIGLNVYYYLNPSSKEIGIITNLVLSEAIIVLPVLTVTLIAKRGETLGEILGFHKIKISTALMIVLFTFLVMPLATLLNAISMLFVDNQIADMTGDMLHVPFFLMFLLMAVYGPLCEEIVFRGVIYHSFRHSRNLVFSVIGSAVLFGLMHLNFNQAPYAIALGIMMALLVEATGSTTSSFLLHFIFNGETVCIMFLENKLMPKSFLKSMENQNYSSSELISAISVSIVMAAICTTLAFCLLNKIAENENRHHFLPVVWGTRHNHREKIVTPALVISVVLCLIYMIADVLIFSK